MVNFADATALAPQLASQLMRLLPRELQDAFMQAPDVFMLFMSMGLAALVVAVFWMLTGMSKASQMARIALRGQALKRTKDHRALVLIAEIEGGDRLLRQEMKEAVEDNFGMFSFEQDVRSICFRCGSRRLRHALTQRRAAASPSKPPTRSSVRRPMSSSGANAACWENSICASPRCPAMGARTKCRTSN